MMVLNIGVKKHSEKHMVVGTNYILKQFVLNGFQKAMELYQQQQKNQENSNLITELWGENNE